MTRATTLLVAAACAAPALATDPVFWSTEDNTLYRTTVSGGTTSYTLSDDIVGMTRASDGTIYASSASPTAAGGYELYTLDVSGTPSLTLLTAGLSRPYNSLTMVGDTLWGAERFNLVTINLNTFAETTVGDVGYSGLGGAAYEASSDTYFLSTADSAQLLSADYALVNGPSPAGSPIGAFGIDLFHNGMELWQGELYMAAQFNNSTDFEIGTVDKSNGAYTSLTTVHSNAVGGTTALVITPAPGAGALAALAVLVAARRQR